MYHTLISTTPKLKTPAVFAGQQVRILGDGVRIYDPFWSHALRAKTLESVTLKIPYMGAEGEKLVKTLKRKIQTNISRKINIRIIYTTNKLSKFCSVKDQRNNVIYLFKCPGCDESYVGKTNCCFGKRTDEHGRSATTSTS